jgi:hypothetical protein
VKGVILKDIVEYYYLKNTDECFDEAIKKIKIIENWCERWTKIKNERARLLRKQAENLTPNSEIDAEI